MINNLEFAERLKKVMDYYQLSAATFADRIGVQRSSISHLLSGRNRPSLDFVLKVLDEFPSIELYWLLNGKGTFPKSESSSLTPIPKSNISDKELTDTEIDRIIIFYKDGTFKNYQKKS
jgi:transcriptional regulator with XRE-family HTH domain